MQRSPQTFPPHWGPPPSLQTRDIRPLPPPYGLGSSTLLSWITSNLSKDASAEEEVRNPVIVLESSPPFNSLIGSRIDDAIVKLEDTFNDYVVQKIPEGSMVTMDYRVDRIRVFYDESGKVVGAPNVG
ncbi:hypothetical protein TrVE_jg6372 [Triparma verrucosa]|uniref:Subtilisin inhibitor 1 n=1 Tax=Triparma verrucosa TaxID=1606542 RepID=A0A9W7B7L5_9STRA|nr:hypothetical protein TrVE_jg6372 [Triparma verrucosa]